MSEFFQVYVDNMAEWWPQLQLATYYTIGLTVLAFLLAIVLGLVAALGKLSRLAPIRRLAIVSIMGRAQTLSLNSS